MTLATSEGSERTRLSRVHNTPATVLGRSACVKRKAGAALLLLFCLLAACTHSAFVPDAPEPAHAVRQTLPGVTVEIAANAWNGKPSSLPETVLPVFVHLRNAGEQAFALSRQDFAMIDQNSRQYLPIPPAEVMAMLGGGNSGVGIHPSVGVGGSSAGGSFIGGGLGFSFDSGTWARDIVPLALAEGPIQSGAEARGFLYFPRPAPDVSRIRVVGVLRTATGPAPFAFHFHRGQ